MSLDVVDVQVHRAERDEADLLAARSSRGGHDLALTELLAMAGLAINALSEVDALMGDPARPLFDAGEWRGAADGNGKIIELKGSERA